MKAFAYIVVLFMAVYACPQPYDFCGDLKVLLEYYCQGQGQDVPLYGPGPDNPYPSPPDIGPPIPEYPKSPYYMPSDTKTKRGRK